ncbi:MAG TPA: prepilin-type N-terminal cleavage/methylation domain-containing protein [Kofleriaceae bacterium]|nr:prepilin-type N-terminal cleavage/methylation domain-containing protein [Kofleriaceae bacterium]
MRRRRAGFTLIEMMVVVTIIGVLVTMAIVYMRGRVRPVDVANRVGDLVREASRRAVALGPVSSNVAVALGSTARTQISAVATTNTLPGPAGISFTTVVFTLWRLQDVTPTVPIPSCTGYPCWVPIETYKTDSNVDVDSWVLHKVAGYGEPTRTSNWSAWVFPGPGSTMPIPPLQCRPDGTCDSCSIFFKAVLPGPSCDPAVPTTVPLNDQCGKLGVLPLGGAINTRMDWN